MSSIVSRTLVARLAQGGGAALLLLAQARGWLPLWLCLPLLFVLPWLAPLGRRLRSGDRRSGGQGPQAAVDVGQLARGLSFSISHSALSAAGVAYSVQHLAARIESQGAAAAQIVGSAEMMIATEAQTSALSRQAAEAAKEKKAAETQIADFEKASKAKVADITKSKAAGPSLTPEQVAMNKAADDAITAEKAAFDAKKKELTATIPPAIFPLKNPGLISMAGAFLFGILFSLMGKEVSAEEKFEEEKLRTYVGIGAE